MVARVVALALKVRAVQADPKAEDVGGVSAGVSDVALLVAFGNGDLLAARDLTARLTPRLFGQASRMFQDRAEAEEQGSRAQAVQSAAQEALLARIGQMSPADRRDFADRLEAELGRGRDRD